MNPSSTPSLDKGRSLWQGRQRQCCRSTQGILIQLPQSVRAAITPSVCGHLFPAAGKAMKPSRQLAPLSPRTYLILTPRKLPPSYLSSTLRSQQVDLQLKITYAPGHAADRYALYAVFPASAGFVPARLSASIGHSTPSLSSSFCLDPTLGFLPLDLLLRRSGAWIGRQASHALLAFQGADRA